LSSSSSSNLETGTGKSKNKKKNIFLKKYMNFESFFDIHASCVVVVVVVAIIVLKIIKLSKHMKNILKYKLQVDIAVAFDAGSTLSLLLLLLLRFVKQTAIVANNTPIRQTPPTAATTI
jgi:hypothetical protein